MKNDFAFCVISYNQERYVYQHLESIKYLIEKYGQNKNIQLIFSDDRSMDMTLVKAKKWIDINKEIFSKVTILDHQRNQGTIRNILDAVDHVESPMFKLMGCDDLYFINNVFNVNPDKDIIISNDVEFWDDGNIKKDIYMEYYKMFCNRNSSSLKEFIRKRLEYDQVISPVSSFTSLRIWRDLGLRDFLLQFKYIEDLPLWYYVFNRYKGQLDIEVSDTRYTMYRLAVGVSADLKPSTDSPVGAELVKIHKQIKANKYAFPRLINPYRLSNKIQNFYWRNIANVQEKKCFFDLWDSDLNKAKKHLIYILNRAEAFEKENT